MRPVTADPFPLPIFVLMSPQGPVGDIWTKIGAGLGLPAAAVPIFVLLSLEGPVRDI